MKHLARALASLLLVALAACGQQTAPAPQTIKGTVTTVEGMPPIMGGALLLANIAAMGPAPAAVTPINEQIYATTLTGTGQDGSLELVLPDGGELPDELLFPASGFFYGFDYETCDLTTSADTLVTALAVSEIPVPAVLLMTFEGPSIALATAAPVDVSDPGFTLFDLPLFTWVYAESAVAIATPEGGCTFDTVTVDIDLRLEAGWNLVATELEADATGTATGLSYTNASSVDLYFNPLIF